MNNFGPCTQDCPNRKAGCSASCEAFRALGHEAYSCDIQEPSGGHPEWHILGDALKAINGGIITTMDGVKHDVGKWNLLIAHPPCTHSVSGARWFAEGKKPLWLRYEAAAFFMRFVECDVPKIAVENPVSVMSTLYRKADQVIHPWQFGHPEEKSTCLWLKGLPMLEETENVKKEFLAKPKRERERLYRLSPGKDRAKIRSKTFPGIAKAMAEQWGGMEEDAL